MSFVRRAVVGSVAAVAMTAALAAILVPVRTHLSVATTALVLVVPVVVGVVVGGFPAGAFAVVSGFLVFDYVFIPPYYTFTVGSAENWTALVVYGAVMLLVASVVSRLDKAQSEARAREETISRLFELTDLLIEDRPLPEVLELIVSTVQRAFGLRSVALLLPAGGRLEVVASAGDELSADELRQVAPVPGVVASVGVSPGGGHRAQTVALSATGRPVGLLGIWGAALSHHDAELMRTFANHMALTLERAQLRERVMRTELLEKIDHLQRALLSAVSHDLRTPLSTIKVSASTLRNPSVDVAPEQEAELLELIDHQVDRLDRLVTNLLDLNRMQAGVLELHREPIAVVDLVSDALRGLAPVAEEVPVTLAMTEGLPLVDVDHVLIGQVLKNLIENAVRHAPPGTAVTVSACPGPDGQLTVTVDDEGPGVPPGEWTEVFTAFNRRGAAGGTGVGLSIAKGFLEAHGQGIRVERAPGGGARFCFTLPVAGAAAVVS